MTIQVRWIGHATALIELDGVRVLTDPVLSNRLLPLVRRRAPGAPEITELADVDAVLISHAHLDHLHLPSLRRLAAGTRLIVPAGLGRWVERRGYRHVEELTVGGRTHVGPIEVRATPAAHQGSRWPFGPAAPALGYLLQGSSCLYFAGDTDLFDEMAELPRMLDGPLDLALLPVGGWGPTLRGGHLDPVRAAEALRRLRPHEVIPIHWGTFWPAGLAGIRPDRFHLPARSFRAAAASVAPAVRVRLLRPGETMRTASRP